jgi:HEAT repeats/PBS lyase HEAT-like repeat
MDKLVERETATRNPFVAAPALAVQFFLIPLAVVAVTALVYIGFRSLLTDERTPQEYLAEIQTGGLSRQWPAAFELSRLMDDPAVRRDKALGPALVQAFEAAQNDDPRVRRYLALAIGRLEPPLPPEAVAALSKALNEPGTEWKPDWFSRFNGWTEIDINEARISTIWALGSSGDPTVVPTLEPLYSSGDAGIRKMVVYALGALPGDAQLETLRGALQDEAPDVRWNAAVALARHGSHDGVPVLGQMLDRSYVEPLVKRDVTQYEDLDPVADVLITGLRAAAALKDERLKPPIEALSREDRSMKVRQAAIEALETMRS